jgi:hypothetical protein
MDIIWYSYLHKMTSVMILLLLTYSPKLTLKATQFKYHIIILSKKKKSSTLLLNLCLHIDLSFKQLCMMIYVTDDSEILLILYWIFTIDIDFFLLMLYFLRNEKTKLLFCTTGILLRKLAVCPLFNLTLLNLWFLSLSQIMFHQQIFRGQLLCFSGSSIL